MAQRTFTIDQLVARAQQITDIENDQHLSSAELFSIANSAIAETWDAIIAAGLGEKYVKKATFNTVAGQLAYPLFTIASDFYRISQVYVDEGSGQIRPITNLNPVEVQTFRPVNSVVPMILYYIPYSPVLTTGQMFDGINGWEEHTIMTMACAIKLKKEDNYTVYAQRKRELESRMMAMGNTDFSEPRRIARKRTRRIDPFYLYRNNVNAYLVRGDAIELMYNYGYFP